MAYIIDENGHRTEDGKGEYFDQSVAECEATIAFYFDMSYGDSFTIVDGRTETEYRYCEECCSGYPMAEAAEHQHVESETP